MFIDIIKKTYGLIVHRGQINPTCRNESVIIPRVFSE